MKFKTIIMLFIVFFGTTVLQGDNAFVDANCWNPEREELTLLYMKQHAGIDSVKLENPEMIVIHYTVTRKIKETLEYFKSPYLETGRTEIINGGKLNVGVHFIVDSDGTVYSSIPEKYFGRHVIGFNHAAFGIENVALNAKGLTKKQLESDARLVSYLVKKYPTIRYLIGHHEYTRKDKPHYALCRELDKGYIFHETYDPGDAYMARLRALLKTKYKIILKL